MCEVKWTLTQLQTMTENADRKSKSGKSITNSCRHLTSMELQESDSSTPSVRNHTINSDVIRDTEARKSNTIRFRRSFNPEATFEGVLEVDAGCMVAKIPATTASTANNVKQTATLHSEAGECGSSISSESAIDGTDTR
mmetsp:Transcript_33082/g.77395  ORF Transcript_33082/g.77395 Transcript_33082/m.77395 type:complete len:139 (+) Transcript_33082:715-1131(+)